jgi:hypothetical protein
MKTNEISIPGKLDKTNRKKPVINMTILKEESGYSAFGQSGKYSIHTEGADLDDLKQNIMEAVNLAYEEEGITYNNDEIKFTFDMESFFAFYKVINAKALSERIGMNQSLLAQYIKGIKKPSPVQAKRILTGVHQIGKELSEASFLI